MRRLDVVVNDDFTALSHYQHLTTLITPDFPNPIREQFGLFPDLGATICQDVTPARSGVPHTLRGPIIGLHFFYSATTGKSQFH